MRLTPHRAAAAVAATALVALVGGCGSQDDWSAPHGSPSPLGSLSAAFVGPTTPAPEATVKPAAGSWDSVHPPQGYRVVLLAGASDAVPSDEAAAVRAESDAVAAWAEAEGVWLKSVTVTDPGTWVDGIVSAIDLKPDLVVGVGNDLMSPLALVSASHLDQQFLALGAQTAEPTVNVTAAVWEGASQRSEGVGPGSTFDPAAVTPDRAATALRAGVASVLSGYTGIVVWLT